MKILHVLSQTELTGAEVYAATLADAQVGNGHAVTLISDKLHVPTRAGVEYQPISKRNWVNRIRMIRILRRFIRENRIDVVHAHSRAASWVCFWATRGSKIAYVSTIHGRQHLHLSLKLLDVYGDRVLAICENVLKHLTEKVGMRTSKVSCVPNGLTFSITSTPVITPLNAEGIKILIAGRTSGPKGLRTSHMIRHVLPELMSNNPHVRVSIAGGPLSNFDACTLEALNTLKRDFGERILARESIPVELLQQIIARADLVIASGRIAIDALAAGRQLIALGEGCCHGLIHPENLAEGFRSNFGDIHETEAESVDYDLLLRDLNRFVSSPKPAPPYLAGRVREHYSISKLSQCVDSVYFAALLGRRVPRNLPILMYHKVVQPDYESPHKTYVTEDNFKTHLETLKKSGAVGVTFQDLYDAAIFGKELPRKPVMITFDDGYRGTYERALPLLKRYGFRAVFYLLGRKGATQNTWDPIDSESALIGEDDIKALASEGMEVGAHSVSHRNFSNLNQAEIESEVQESKSYLEQITGKPILSFAYPFGGISDLAKGVLSKSGVFFAVATDSGRHSISEEPMQIFRCSVFPTDGAWQIRKKSARYYKHYFFLKRRRVSARA